MHEFKLPDVGEGLHEAELLEWDVSVGDIVADGDAVAQVSTDKVNVELTAPCGGVVAELSWSPGDVIQVGEILMCIDDGKGEQSATVAENAAAAETQATPAAAQAQRKKVKAGPTVRRYAAQKEVDLTLVEPSGAGGQIVQQDIDDYLAQSPVSRPVAEPAVECRRCYAHETVRPSPGGRPETRGILENACDDDPIVRCRRRCLDGRISQGSKGSAAKFREADATGGDREMCMPRVATTSELKCDHRRGRASTGCS